MTKRERALVRELEFWYRVMRNEGEALPDHREYAEWTREALMDGVRKCRNAVDAVRLCVFTLTNQKRNASLASHAQGLVNLGVTCADFYTLHANCVEWEFWSTCSGVIPVSRKETLSSSRRVCTNTEPASL